MSSINMNSVLKKVDKYINNNKNGEVSAAVEKSFKKNIGKSSNNPDEAASTLISMIGNYAGAQLPPNVASIASDLVCSDITYNSDGTATAYINFSGELGRPSLVGHKTGKSLDNIVALYNSGVDHVMKRVHGLWHGDWVGSRTEINETRFLQEAIESFKTTYRETYDIINVTLSEEYK